MIEKLPISNTEQFADVNGMELCKIKLKINEIIEVINNKL